MAAIGLLLPIFQFFDTNGDPLTGGKVSTYIAGTSTPSPTWTDSDLAVPNENPVILDSAGRCVMYVDTTPSLKLIVTDANDVEQWSQDNISPAALAT